MSAQSFKSRMTAPQITARKGGEPVVCLTAYDAPTAAIMDEHCDLILVGDSVGMVVHGLTTTVGVTLDMMIMHGQAVMRGAQQALVVVDLPFGSYEDSPETAFRNASRVMMETGCQAVKIESGSYAAETISYLVERGIPVMSHVGLRPQSMNVLGGFRDRGHRKEVADQIIESRMPQRTTITVRRKRIISMLGIEPADGNIEDIFTRLGIKHERHDKGWDVTPPSYRYDLAIEEDYVEEVARVVGFDALPRTYPAHRPQFRPVPETRIEVNAIKRQLMHRGYQEVVTYSFVDADMQSALRPDLEALALANPISSELAVMRTTLIGGLLQTLKHNQSRQIPSMQIFETGLRFLPNPQETALGELDEYIAADWGDDLQIDSTLQQQSMLAGLVYGQQHAENWNSGTAAASFFSLKADVEALIASANGVAQ